MTDALNSVSSLARSLVSLVVLGLVGTASWIGYQSFSSSSTLKAELEKKDAQVQALTADLAVKNKRIAQLDLAIRLLKQDHRVAEITVIDQWESDESKRPLTKLQFVEIGNDGRAIGKQRVFTIDGDVLYVEAWIVKYLDRFIEAGDPLRGTAVCLFKRLYGEFQEPNDGFPLDAVGSRPAAYDRGSQMPDFEKEVWEKFWDFANDPDKAEQAGLRAAHGDAPFVKLRPGKVYTIELRASDGLTIKPKDAAAIKDENL